MNSYNESGEFVLKKYIGDTTDDVDILIQRTLKEYSNGYNSVFFAFNHSITNPRFHLYVCKKKTDIQVKYPEYWLREAYRNCKEKENSLKD